MLFKLKSTYYKYMPQQVLILQSLFKSVFFIVIIVTAVFSLSGCNATTDKVACDPDHPFVMNLEDPGEELTTGYQEFQADFLICSNYYGWRTSLYIYGPKNENPQGYFVNYYLPSSGTSDSHTYSFVFQRPGLYQISVITGTGTAQRVSQDYDVNVTGEIFKEYRIKEFSMVGDDLWPDYLSSNPPYYGRTKRDYAYVGANTVITELSELKDIAKVSSFLTEQALVDWCLAQLGGDWGSKDITFLAGIEDVSFNTPGGANAMGITFQGRRLDGKPELSFLLYSRLRTRFTNPYDRTRFIVGTTLHELGHARGLSGQGHDNGDTKCIMWEDRVPNDFTIPGFCDNHKNELKTISWKISQGVQK